MVSKGEVEWIKEEELVSPTGVKGLGCSNVGKVLMVSPNVESKFCPLLPVSPFLQGSLNGQQLPVSNRLISLSCQDPEH